MTLRELTKDIQRRCGGLTVDGIYGPATARMILANLPIKIAPDDYKKPGADFDKRTEKNLATLEPKARLKFRKFISAAVSIAAGMGCDYKAISGQRGEAEQNRLFAQGRTAPGRKVTNARFGSSNHNFGIALDFGVFAGGRYLDSSNPRRASAVHKAVAAVADRYSIKWGGDWRTPDIPHFEIDVGLTFAQKRSRSRAGKTMFS